MKSAAKSKRKFDIGDTVYCWRWRIAYDAKKKQIATKVFYPGIVTGKMKFRNYEHTSSFNSFENPQGKREKVRRVYEIIIQENGRWLKDKEFPDTNIMPRRTVLTEKCKLATKNTI